MVNLKRMQDRQYSEIMAKKDKQVDESRNEKSSVQNWEEEDKDNNVILLSREGEKALINRIFSQENKLNQLQKRINELAAAFNAYQETVQGSIDETVRTFADKAGEIRDDINSYRPQVALHDDDKDEIEKLVYALNNSSLSQNIDTAILKADKRVEELLSNGAKVESSIRGLIQTEINSLLDALKVAVEDYKKNLKSINQEQQNMYTDYLDRKMKDYQNRRQWSETLNHSARRWYWYVWLVVITICAGCLGLVNSCSRAHEREENARLWIEHGRLWDYYREKNPKTNTKLMEEYYKTHKKLGEE